MTEPVPTPAPGPAKVQARSSAPPAAPDSHPTRTALLVVAALAVVGGGVAASMQLNDPPAPPASIPIDAWAPYWELDTSTQSLTANGSRLREVSPFWYSATGAEAVGLSQYAQQPAADAFVAEARRLGIPVLPSVVDEMPSGGMAAVLDDPTTRAAHVDTLVALANGNDFAGLDIDYEAFAFKDSRDTWEATRPNWVAFVQELSAELRRSGKLLTVSIPPPSFSVYAYGEIEPYVDRIRVMAYDYSTAEPGPIAPLFFVEEVIDAARAATDDDSKLVLGVALYGRNWLKRTTGTCPADAPGDVVSVHQGNIDELIATRGATPTRNERNGEVSFEYSLELTDGVSTCTQLREVHYVDAQGAAERVDLARRSFLGGASLWALGFDSPATWAAITPLASAPPPQSAPTSVAGP
jgi:spore germination protein YaaH